MVCSVACGSSAPVRTRLTQSRYLAVLVNHVQALAHQARDLQTDRIGADVNCGECRHEIEAGKLTESEPISRPVNRRTQAMAAFAVVVAATGPADLAGLPFDSPISSKTRLASAVIRSASKYLE
jgi:hypothetical protein